MYIDPALGFPWIPFVFVLVVGIGGGVYLLRKLPQPPPPPQLVMDWFEFFKPSLLWLLAVVLLWIGLSAMVKASCKPGPVNTGGQAVFESFVNPNTAEYKLYLSKVEDAIDRTSKSIEKLTNGTDDTCDMIRDIEEVWVGNEAAPKDSSETELSPERQRIRQDLRRKRGQERFNTARTRHANAVSNLPVLECFEEDIDAVDAQDDAELEEDELRIATQELESLLDTADVRLAAVKVKQMTTALMFAEYQFEKAIEEQEKEKEDADIEFFTNPLPTGVALLRHIDGLLEREMKFTKMVNLVLLHVKRAKQLERMSKGLAADLDDGKVPEKLVEASAPAPKPARGKCPKNMYQFASYSGGFCCPTVPTDYDRERNDYAICPVKGVCALHDRTKQTYPVCGTVPKDPEPTKGHCKEGMFQYNTSNGGFCCPTKPINYSPELKEYTTCPNVGTCALNSEKTLDYPLCPNAKS
jgi:hypothetical protein